MTKMRVPKIDLPAEYAGLREEVRAALERVFAAQRFILGPEGEALEREIATYCGTKHAIGCASGSDALLLCLLAQEVKAEDEVITVPFTFFATAGAVARLGARARFVDIAPRTFNLDPRALAQLLTALPGAERRRIRVVIPVHLYGQPAEMKEILALANQYELAVIEDAAQAMGADYGGRRVGSFGRAGCLSFYPTKNLGGYGDGGMVTTDDEALASRLRALRQHGSLGEKYRHDYVGFNSRLDELQAAVLRVKLKYLEEWNAQRRECALRYDRMFAESGLIEPSKTYPDASHPVVIPQRAAQCRHVFHQYVIRAQARDALKEFLAKEGVETEIYYPSPLHLQPCFHAWGYRRGDFAEAERAAEEVLALPLYPGLTEEMQAYVVSKLREFYRG